ncbi:MAG TPA: hypothetical protein VG309_11940, partial [Rhizomicrobium sp.]|nr:hypothetical protein [Rhizomicrobium sp.]
MERNSATTWGAAVVVILALALAWWLIPSLHPSIGKSKPVADQFPNDQFPSTYKPYPFRPTLIRNATVLTGTDKEIDGGDVLMEGGKIVAVGKNLAAPAGA